jgi:hypothetical protein
VFEGVAAGVVEVVPEARTLASWARELGIDPGLDVALETGSPGTVAAGAPPPTVSTLPTPADAIRVLAVKGYCLPAALATALHCALDGASALLDGLVAAGLAEAAAGSVRLTAEGKAEGGRLIADDTTAWGLEAASAALDAFLVLDGRMKETVTAWQVREVAGAQAPNDHTDFAYDASVRAGLAALHADATAWLAPCAAALPRLAWYGDRLSTAAEAVVAGDGRFIASPRVDSYHGVWFELHEDLILLAGRTRSDEVAAGRA